MAKTRRLISIETLLRGGIGPDGHLWEGKLDRSRLRMLTTMAYLADNETAIWDIETALLDASPILNQEYGRLVDELRRIKQEAETNDALATHIARWLQDPTSYEVVYEFTGPPTPVEVYVAVPLPLGEDAPGVALPG